jgi:hypothetical protein
MFKQRFTADLVGRYGDRFEKRWLTMSPVVTPI